MRKREAELERECNAHAHRNNEQARALRDMGTRLRKIERKLTDCEDAHDLIEPHLERAHKVVEVAQMTPFSTLVAALEIARVAESNPKWGQAIDYLDALIKSLEEYDNA